MVSKKQKRLEKYIEKKLLKESTAKLMDSLSKSSHSVEQGLLKSTKHLYSKKEKKAQHKIESLEQKRSIKVTMKKKQQQGNADMFTRLEESSSDSEREIEQVRSIPQQAPSTLSTIEIESEPECEAKKTSTDDEMNISHLSPSSTLPIPLPTTHIQPNRTPSIQQSRLQLPIVQEEQQVMETIQHNLITILCGETGCGKSTQVPQFLYEYGYGQPDSDNYPSMIAITQPRRVAAMSTCNRVKEELGSDEHCGYVVRFDVQAQESCRIIYFTDGVLLASLSTDFLLSKYSVVIIDEAHERNLNTDILIGILSRLVRMRLEMYEKGERIMIGSHSWKATPLRLIIMSATLRVDDFSQSRLFSWLNTPPPIINIKSRQYEVRVHFSKRTSIDYLNDAYDKILKIHQRLPDGGILVFVTGQREVEFLCNKLQEYEMQQKRHSLTLNECSDDGTVLPFSDDESETEEIETQKSNLPTPRPTHIHPLPLYANLPSHLQLLPFQPPPPSTRTIIIATNLAETSLTLPNIHYIIDTGRVKHYTYSHTTQKYEITWISKASAQQRTGRAGRTSKGHCYRLYSSTVYEQLQDYDRPQVETMPLDSIVLRMKSLGIVNIRAFPFVSVPDTVGLNRAEELLKLMSATNQEGRVTDMGRIMNAFPVAPRLAKMIIAARELNCVEHVIVLVAGITMGITAEHRVFSRDKTSQLLNIITMIGAYRHTSNTLEFCSEYKVNDKSMREVVLLIHQLTRIAQDVFGIQQVDSSSNPPTLQIRQSILAAYPDKLAIRCHKSKPLYTLMTETRQPVELIYTHLIANPPEYIVFTSLVERGERCVLEGVSVVDGMWMLKWAPMLCWKGKKSVRREKGRVVERVRVLCGPGWDLGEVEE